MGCELFAALTWPVQSRILPEIDLKVNLFIISFATCLLIFLISAYCFLVSGLVF